MGMSKSDRLLHILNLLRSRKNLSAGHLAKECGVTERSIYRDIISLSECQVPIYFDNGYKLASDNFLPPLNFDYDEYHLIKLALESTPLRKTSRYAGVARRVRAKIEVGLSEGVKQKRRFSTETTRIDITSDDEAKKGERFYGVIEEAISGEHCLSLAYDSITSGMTARIVEPYFIIFKGSAFYFVAFCRLRDDFRTFRIDRVHKAEMLTQTFRRRRDVNAETYFEDSWQIYIGEPVEVVVHFSGTAARVVQMSTHHPRESVKLLKKGIVEYRVPTRGIEEIQRWILGFGAEAKVVSPISLRERIAKIGRLIAG
jgi:predicted DNA-binding transcriptional regulator YafY